MLLASVEIWNINIYIFPFFFVNTSAHLGHIVTVCLIFSGVVRYSDVEGQRPYKLHRFLDCIPIVSSTFREEVFRFFLVRVECPTIPNTWLLSVWLPTLPFASYS